MLKRKPKILVALSGGVDSAVAAALLVSKGFAVTAAYMINYKGANKFGESCFVPDYRDAVRSAATLSIPILKLDFTKEYQKQVLDYMFQEYQIGRTPNPDILCNKYIKFGSWLTKARELGFDFLATGHYANIKTLKHKNIKTYYLRQAKDTNKDQTYFLHQLTQSQLQQVMFPVGNYTKPEVRKLAKKFKLPVAEKEESMGICFVGEVPMKEFLQTKIKPNPGKVIMYQHSVGVENFQPLQIGEHEGLPFYTIGQRHTGVTRYALDVTQKDKNTKPLYVIDKHTKTNELVVGFEDDPLLYKKEIQVSDINWVSRQPPKFPLKCSVRLRHRQELQKGVVVGGLKGVLVQFTKPQRAITPGQFAVFYSKGECLGGGVIGS